MLWKFIEDKMQWFIVSIDLIRRHNTISLLTDELKGINPQIKNARHIRASVILHWFRQYNKRQVQYMAGHKYINSTEIYEVQELETLTSNLQNIIRLDR